MTRKQQVFNGIHLGVLVPLAYRLTASFFDLKSNFLLLMLVTVLLAVAFYGILLRLVDTYALLRRWMAQRNGG